MQCVPADILSCGKCNEEAWELKCRIQPFCIYKEINVIADSLANEAPDSREIVDGWDSFFFLLWTVCELATVGRWLRMSLGLGVRQLCSL